jgi:hypothetical protein
MATRKLIGTDPDQVPVNGDLGTLAFQDSDYVKVTTIETDLINNVRVGLGGINKDVRNTMLGYNAFPSTATGIENTAIGFNTLNQITTGARNTAVGAYVLNFVTTGTSNTAVGTVSMRYNTSGSRNTAVGDSTLFTNTTGTRNNGIGNLSLAFNTTGSYNTASGYAVLYVNTTGSYNTAIGALSGRYLTTGSKNSILGSYSGNQFGLDIRTANNNIVLSDGDGNPRQYYDGTNNAWVLQTAGSERLRIDTSGNVGIGTSSPSDKLTIAGNVSATNATYGFFQVSSGAVTGQIASNESGASVDIRAVSNHALDFHTNNTRRMRIDASGNVGIGTGSPNTTLEATKTITFLNTDTFGQFVIKSASGATGKLLNFGVDEANNISFIQSVNRGIDTNNLVLQRYGSNVGIGTSTPTAKLDVAGGMKVSGQLITGASGSVVSPLVSAAYISGTSNMYLRNIGGTNRIDSYNDPITATIPLQLNASQHTFYIADAEKMRIDASGNVGIGRTAPVGKLEVNGSIVSSIGDTNGFGFNRAGIYRRALSLDGVDDLRLFNEVNNDLLFGTNNTERLRINNAGNVGIGTSSPDTSPSTKLHIREDDAVDYKARAVVQATDQRLVAGSHYQFGVQAYSYLQSTNDAENVPNNLLLNPDGGNVGIGTSTPGHRLEVVKSNPSSLGAIARFYHGPASDRSIEFGTSSISPFPLYIQGRASGSATNDMALQPEGGNVGIGTNSPSRKLHVAGDVFSSGQIFGQGAFICTFISDINANTNRVPGVYGSYSAGATNTPTNSGILWNGMSGASGDGSLDGGQLWQDYGTNNFYTRKRWGGGFSAWALIGP